MSKLQIFTLCLIFSLIWMPFPCYVPHEDSICKSLYFLRISIYMNILLHTVRLSEGFKLARSGTITVPCNSVLSTSYVRLMHLYERFLSITSCIALVSTAYEKSISSSSPGY